MTRRRRLRVARIVLPVLLLTGVIAWTQPREEHRIVVLLVGFTTVAVMPVIFSVAAWAVRIPKVARYKRRRSWRSAGCCLGCGYSLRGNTSGVCPECGTPVARKGEEMSEKPVSFRRG